VTPRLRLSVLPPRLAVCRLPSGAALPEWAAAALARPGAGLVSVTRTAKELSLVVTADAVTADAVPADTLLVDAVPAGAPELRVETGFRALEVAGPLDFALVGVLAALTAPLAEAGVSLFAVSTFDTDYLLVREAELTAAEAVLTAAGHRIG